MTGFEKGQNVPKNLNMINKVCASHHITDSPGLLFFFFFFYFIRAAFSSSEVQGYRWCGDSLAPENSTEAAMIIFITAFCSAL